MPEETFNGHLARLLLGQPVGVDAGQGLDERRFAMIDVAGGADDVHVGRWGRVAADLIFANGHQRRLASSVGVLVERLFDLFKP